MNTTVEMVDGGTHRRLISRRDGRTVASVSVGLERSSDSAPRGWLGFFEAIPDPDPVRVLFREACRWLKEEGAGAIVGPLNADTWHSYRLNLGPFTDPPFAFEPVNPPYYRELWERSGFTLAARYSSVRVPDTARLLPALEARALCAARSGFRFRTLDPANWREELSLIHGISMVAFRDAYLFSPISLEEFSGLYDACRSAIDPQLVWFAEDARGRPAGFLFCYRYSSGPEDALCVKSMAVYPEHGGCGLGSALLFHAYRSALELGISQAVHCLMHEGNLSERLDRGTGQVLRRYGLFELRGAVS